MGFLVWFLVCALGLSLFANMHLLHQHSLHSHTESGEDGEGFIKLVRSVEASLASLSPTPPDESDGEQKDDDTHMKLATHAKKYTQMTKIEGVAIAVLLHSPKWFQRRYTMMVQNVYNNIPANWKIQIFYVPYGGSQVGFDINRGLQRMADEGKIVLTQFPDELFKRKKKRIQLMTDEWTWDAMLADKVFVFGGNGVVCSNSPLNFTTLSDQYDYLGAPWGMFKGRGGEGGMSFRNRKMMKAAIHYATEEAGNDTDAYRKWGQEDHFFVKTLVAMEKEGALPEGSTLRLAGPDDTKAYGAIGKTAEKTVLVASGTLPGLDDKGREAFIQLCPEVKMFYPSLHNPNCFGAKVYKDLCAKSICALNKEKGGC